MDNSEKHKSPCGRFLKSEKIVGEGEVINMMGIGYHNHNKNIRQHHYDDRITYPSFEKSIEVIDK